MGKPTKDAAPGKSAKTEDVPDPNTAPSAPPVSEGDYEYYEETDAGGRERVEEYAGSIARRPLPNIPDSAAPGQSRTSALGGAVMDGQANNALSNLGTGSPSGQHEAFILRNLTTFKGEYNGTAITDWIQKVELLIRLTKVPADSLLPLLLLRVDPQVVDFLEGLRSRLSPSEHTWARVKQALLQQYGGAIDPNKQVNKLRSARMRRETPVRQFAQEVERLARLAYPELASDIGTPEQLAIQKNILNRITVEQFVSGLPPMLSRSVVERQIKDFDEAVKVAAHLEEVNARYFSKSSINAFFSPENEDSHPRRETLSSAQATDSSSHHDSEARQADRHRNKSRGASTARRGNSRPSNRNPVREVRCYQCNELGHIRRECPLNRCFICGDGHPTHSCTNIVCANCKQAGHPANRCSKNSRGHPSHITTS